VLTVTSVIPNPFLVVSQREGEDRVTYVLGTVLAAGGATLLADLLRVLGADVPDAIGPLEVEFQPAGPVSRPDARFEIAGGTAVLFENKIVPGMLFEEQIRGHLDSFGAARPSARKILLAITPDPSPPAWWGPRASAHANILFVHGSWRVVVDWARLAGADGSRSELARFMLDGFVNYVEQRSGMIMTAASFAPERMARVARDAGSWLKDLEEQHAAQEAFLTGVASGLWKALGRGEDEPWMKVGSRWGKTWTPVSSYLEFWWPTPKLHDMPTAHVWTEAYLDEKEGAIKLRTGVLFEGRVQVAGWYGIAREAASRTFGGRYCEYRQGGAYAEVWALQPLDLARLEATQNAVVADLVTWVTVVLEAMATGSGTNTAA
jgi:hypothetical protein